MPSKGFLPFFEGHWRAVTDLLHRDQGHHGEGFGVLRLIQKLVDGPHLREHKTFFRGGRLQIVCTPLQYRILDGCEAVGAP